MNKEKLISVLYGEGDAASLTEAERNALESLREMRLFLQKHPDENPQVVPVTVARQAPILRSKWLAIAASMLILLVAGKLLDLNVSWDKEVFAIQFGHRPDNVSDEILKQMVAQEITNQQETMYQKWDHFQKQVGMTLANLEATFQKPEATIQTAAVDRTMLASFQATMEKDNQLFKEELFESLRLQNEISSESLVNSIIEYINASREDDFQVISKSLQDLAQSIELGNEAFAQYVNQPIQNL